MPRHAFILLLRCCIQNVRRNQLLHPSETQEVYEGGEAEALIEEGAGELQPGRILNSEPQSDAVVLAGTSADRTIGNAKKSSSSSSSEESPRREGELVRSESETSSDSDAS